MKESESHYWSLPIISTTPNYLKLMSCSCIMYILFRGYVELERREVFFMNLEKCRVKKKGYQGVKEQGVKIEGTERRAGTSVRTP